MAVPFDTRARAQYHIDSLKCEPDGVCAQVLGYQLDQLSEGYQVVHYCEGGETLHQRLLAMENSTRHFSEGLLWQVLGLVYKFIAKAEGKHPAPVLSTRCVVMEPLRIIDSTVIRHPYFESGQKTSLQLLHLMLELALGCRVTTELTRKLMVQAMPAIKERYSAKLVHVLEELAAGRLPSLSDVSSDSKSISSTTSEGRSGMHRMAKYYLASPRTVRAGEGCKAVRHSGRENVLPNGIKFYSKVPAK